MKSPLKHIAVAAAAALVSLLLMIGCTSEQSPLATQADNSATIDEGRFTLTLSSPGMPAAKSLIAVEGRVVSEVIGPAGGWLQATEDGPRNRDKLEVRFVVLPKALDQAAFITMEVVGKELSDLVIHFSPAGLRFDPHAILNIRLEKQLYTQDQLEGLTVQHIDGEGNLIESIDPGIKIDSEGTLIITLGVPGFSRYSLP